MFKKIFYSLVLFSTIIGFNSCDNTLDVPIKQEKSIVLMKQPNFVVWSGEYGNIGNTLSSNGTRSSYTNANMYDQDWDCIPNVNLSNEELKELIELFSIGMPTQNNIILPFENYWVQQVYKGESTYIPTDVNGNYVDGVTITGSNQMDKLVAYNENHTEYEYGGYLDENYQWHEVITENHYEHINNFNNGNNTNVPGECGCGTTHFGTTLMTEMSTNGITPTNQFGYHESFGTSHNYNNYIIIQYKGEWYVGFDYEMHKSEAQNSNEAKDVERDWNFTDWIVKITPAYHKGETPIIPEEPSFNSDLDENNIEVNLSINDSHNNLVSEDLWSKLSIHVRYGTDVRIVIPVENKYVCESDDLVILQNHFIYEDLNEHHSVTYNITNEENNQTWSIKLTTTFEIIDNNAGAIIIETDGVTQDLIDYLFDKNQDGINFEIYLYWQSEYVNENGEVTAIDNISRSDLQNYLNNSTIEFLDSEPGLYINAFNKTESGYKWSGDCTVSIISSQAGDFNDSEQGMWHNHSPYNELYYLINNSNN